MKGPRAGIGAELVPLVLILAGLAGSVTLIVSAQRRAAERKPSKPPAVVAIAPAPPRPTPRPAPAPAAPEPAPEPEPPPPPPPEDPTPKALAKLTAAEAEQLLETSKADRRTAALEVARREAVETAERWRRRESLVHAQLDSLDGKVRRLEAEADELAFERDALEKERDARKAAASRARSRPGQAILPHKGQNGTWRRPIVVECRNGMAILQPGGVEFGLFELDSSFGATSNPFVRAVAREAVRVQGRATPDGSPVVPYIFFVVRPDGIRPYYEARGRLEPLGISFGYELADQDWQVEFPDLDEVGAWDGSIPLARADADPGPAARRLGGSPAENAEFPPWPPSRRTTGDAADWPATVPGLAGIAGGEPGGPGRDRSATGHSRAGRGPGPEPDAGGSGLADGPPPGYPDGFDPGGNATGLPPGRPRGESGNDPKPRLGLGRDGAGRPAGSRNPPATSTSNPRGDGPSLVSSGRTGGEQVAATEGTQAARQEGPPGSSLETAGPDPPKVGTGALALEGPKPGPRPGDPGGARDEADPTSTFVWPTPSSADRKPRDRSAGGDDDGSRLPDRPRAGASPKPDPTAPDGLGGGGLPPSGSEDDAKGARPASGKPKGTKPDGSGNDASGGEQAARAMIGPGSAAGSPPAGSAPPPGAAGLGLPVPPAGMTSTSPPALPPKSRSSLSIPDLSPGRLVDRTFEVVVVCGPRGVIVQPGGYRATAAALKDRDGLFQKQIVGLVKARRSADPRVVVEPRVRFLVQSGGFETYRVARSQFLLSGLDWPSTTQVADPDRLATLPMEGW